jgi:isoleucyl-tRNA synthetase
MKRCQRSFDCWFDSGSMPFASGINPFENKEIFEENFLPILFRKHLIRPEAGSIADGYRTR